MKIDFFNFEFFLKSFYVFLIAWLPVFIIFRIVKYLYVDVSDLF